MKWLMIFAMTFVTGCGHHFIVKSNIDGVSTNTDAEAGLLTTDSQSTRDDKHPSLIEKCVAKQEERARDECTQAARSALPGNGPAEKRLPRVYTGGYYGL